MELNTVNISKTTPIGGVTVTPNMTSLSTSDSRVNFSFTTSYLGDMTTMLSDFDETTLHQEITTPLSEFACVGSELSEPDFPLYACSGSKITSWIASVFLLSMTIFGIIKCLTAHGVRNIFDLRLNGISFPKRPEFFVLTCSSLPIIFSVLSRPLFTPLPPQYKFFLLGWGMAQTRFFFDLFTRTATIYHLVYWVYRTPIINLIWRIYQDTCTQCSKIKTQTKTLLTPPKPTPKPVKSVPKRGVKGQPAGRRTRTSDWNYENKRRRSRSNRSNKSNETPTSVPNSSTPTNDTTTTQTVNPAGINLISAQPLFIGTQNLMNPNAMIPHMNGLMNPYGQMTPQGVMNVSDNYGMYGSPAMNGQQSPYMMNMGYMMGYGMPMNMGMDMSNSYSQQNLLYSMGTGSPISDSLQISTSTPRREDSQLTGDNKVSETTDKMIKTATKIKVERPPPTDKFRWACKRIIPGCIYLTSFVITIPSIMAFEPDETEGMILARCTRMCRSYFYYDLVVLITLPTLAIIVAFYHAALAKKQLNGGTKMTYRLRCYYVTFILLNIPMFVLMLTSIGFRLSEKPYRNIYGTGILIAITAYHTNFALKSTVYTTGCNCICCSDNCLRRHPRVGRMIVSLTTPVAIKDQEALLEGTVIPINIDSNDNHSKWRIEK